MTPPQRNLHSDRTDQRHTNSLAAVKAMLKATAPRLAYRRHMTIPQFTCWRQNVCDKLQELMHCPMNPGDPPKRIGAWQREGYRLEKWEFYPDAFAVVPLLMLIPQGTSEQSPSPLVMCFPGSNHTKECLAGEPELPGVSYPNRAPQLNAMALHYVRQGYVAVAVDHPGIGELADPVDGDGRRDLSWNLLWAGSSYESWSISQKRCILAWLRTLAFVDAGRIVMSGHSLGAKPALVMTLLEPDIRALVHNDFMSHWRQRQIVRDMASPGLWHAVPGFTSWFDYVDLMAAAAPTPVLVCEGGRGEWLDLIRDAYQLHHASDHFEVAYYPEYASAAQRTLEYTPIPEGVDAPTYFKYTNVQPQQHWFKPDIALPWLRKILADGTQQSAAACHQPH